MKPQRRIEPRRSEIKPAAPFVAADIESRNWRDLDLLGMFDGQNYMRFAGPTYFLAELERRAPIDCFFHYGGGFDFWFLLGPAQRMAQKRGITLELARASSRLCMIKLGAIRLLDSYAFWHCSLREIVESYQLGPYLAVDDDWATVGDLELQARNEQDCRYLYKAIEIWHRFLDEVGANHRCYSIGAAGLDSWARRLKRPLAGQWSDDEGDDWADEAYIGGRVQAFEPRAKDVLWYDLASAYGWALSQPLPVGPGSEVPVGSIDLMAVPRAFVGFVRATVSFTGNLPFGPLPVRAVEDQDRDLDYRVEYPTRGTAEGIWTTLELGYALALGSVEVERVHAIRLYPTRAYAKDWVSAMFALRPQWPLLAKGIVNALYGKMAQRRESITFLWHPTLREIERHNLIPYLDPHYNLWVRNDDAPLAWKLHATAAIVTSYVRLRLLQTYWWIVRNGGRLVYSDTDSVWYSGEPLDTRWDNAFGGMGSWVLKGRAREFHALTPRTYRADYAALGDDRILVKIVSSGIERLTHRDWVQLCRGAVVDREVQLAWPSAIKRVAESEKSGCPELTRVRMAIEQQTEWRREVPIDLCYHKHPGIFGGTPHGRRKRVR